MDWTRLGYLTGAQAKQYRAKKTDNARAGWLGAHLSRQLAQPIRDGWSRLPLCVRTQTYTGDSNEAKRYRRRTVDLAPPEPDPGTLGRNGSFLVLDASGSKKTLVLALFDWDELRLDRVALDAVGVNSGELLALLVLGRAGASSDELESTDRWKVEGDEQTIRILSGVYGDDNVSPRVGRFALGTIPGSSGTSVLSVEVVALPRLSARTPRGGELVPLGIESAARAWLERTLWSRGSPENLLALLRLAHQLPLAFDSRSVVMSATEDPSPLVWLALADALEKAAEHQRRQYVRLSNEARAPTGTVRFNAYFGNLAKLRADRVPVDRFLLSADTLENRLFRGMSRFVRRTMPAHESLAAWVSDRFDRIEGAYLQASVVEPAVWMCQALLDQELPEVVASAVRHCEAALSGRYPGLEMGGRDLLEMNSFELDVALLFEAAMRTVLGQALGLPVVDGNKPVIANAFTWRRPKLGSVVLKPDFVVVEHKRVTALGDAKYKRQRHMDSFAPLLRADFQQLATYMLAWPEARWAVVLLPHPEPKTARAATHHVATLDLPGGRSLGVFEVASERWSTRTLNAEPLTHWVRSEQVA